LQLNEGKEEMAEEVLGEKGVNFELQNFKAYAKVLTNPFQLIPSFLRHKILK